ncbi:uncharacterized protein M421DRAFT_5081 [Didymella exigua CBS 183.55]|uniref:Rhodopsin domain-containing protein n=1 Tax=Didymella exigua CBS 183.55 TaxID=1150837 RepID=A0A6A5RNA3_9PLEO|nr:uncharacterized protein M421DRAFT_5081 [Didymella exigua CBS 183.55]KAF1928618.1 hypothetical protein M421DRAFT_5081 [Didymella exigua CBS 183.55]
MTAEGPDQIWFLVAAIVCIAIPGLFLMLRVYTRLVIVRCLEPADYFLFLAFPLIVTEIAVGYHMVTWGAGVHQWQITLDQLFNQLYIIYCPLSFAVKMAILMQYLRLFAPLRSDNKFMWYGAWATIVATFVVYTFFTFWTMFYCKPRRMIWDKLTPGGKCHDVNHIILSQGAFNMASDFVILFLPTLSLWQLNVPLARKVFITSLFATGLIACIASAMRIWFTLNISASLAEADVSWNGLFIGIWTALEVSLVFVVACTLCLPKLIQAKGKKFRVALSYVSTPFSAILGIVRRKTGHIELEPSTPQSVGQHVRNSSWEDIELDDNSPKSSEGWEYTRWQEEVDARSNCTSRPLDRPSSAASRSSHSHRSAQRHSNHFLDGSQQQSLHTPELSKQQQPWKTAYSKGYAL